MSEPTITVTLTQKQGEQWLKARFSVFAPAVTDAIRAALDQPLEPVSEHEAKVERLKEEVAHRETTVEEQDHRIADQEAEVERLREEWQACAEKAKARIAKLEAERDANRADALANLDALEKHRRARTEAEQRYTREEVEERLFSDEAIEADGRARWFGEPNEHVRKQSRHGLERAFAAAFPDQQPVEETDVCACSHTRHWHGQEIGAEPGSGACDECGCKQFTTQPEQQGEAEDWPEVWVTKDREGNIVRALVDPASPAAFERLGYTTRHYLPAPAQHPTGLRGHPLEGVAGQLEALGCQAPEKPSEAERARTKAYFDAAEKVRSAIPALVAITQQHPTGLSEGEQLRQIVASAIERAAGPLGRARVRAGGSESRTAQARDLAEVARAITVLRAALNPHRPDDQQQQGAVALQLLGRGGLPHARLREQANPAPPDRHVGARWLVRLDTRLSRLVADHRPGRPRG